MNKILLTLVFLVLLVSITHATSNTIASNTNLIIKGLPYGIGLNLTLLSGWYTINGTTATTNYNIHFITQNGNTIVTIPSYIKPTYGSNLYFNSASLLSQIVLSGRIWVYNLSDTSLSVASGQLVYGQNNILVFYSPFNLTSFYLNETKQLESLGVSINSSIITTLNNLATNNTINLNNILTANQIKSIISSNTFGTNLNTSLIAYRNISKTIPYGYIKLSRNYLSANKAVNFSVFNSSQRTLYIVEANVIKASPQLCVDTNLGDVCTTTNQTTPVPLGVPVINGHFGLTQNDWYPLNVSFKSFLLANNIASWNVTIKDITNGTILFNQIISSKNINVTKNYKIPVTQQVEMTIKTSGDQNYTSLVEDPVTVPTGIQAYVPVNITNSQTSATPSPFQQMINITESTFGNYIAYNNNFANFEYFYTNGTIIPAWIESNSSGKLITWVKLTPSIPANGKLTIYLGFASKTTNLLSSSGTSGIGEAPQLSCPNPANTTSCSTYAQYDDGANVFNNYWNFAGTSLPSGWTQSNGGVTSWSVNNGVSVSEPSSGYQSVYYNTTQQTLSSTGIVFDIYGSYSTPSVNGGFGMPYILDVQTFSTVVTINGSINKFTLIVFDGGSNFVNTPVTFSTVKQVWTFYSIGSGIVLLNNYTNPTVNNKEFSTLTANMGITQNSGATATIFVQWWRTRTVPPNGVMPSVSFGSLVSLYTPPKVSLSANATTLDYGQTFKLIGNVTGGTAPYTFQWALNNSGTYQNITSATSNTFIPSILGAGTYKFNLYVKDSHPTLVLSAPITVTINKIPIPSATFSTNTFTYNGVIPTITFTFNTINNQIPPAVVSLPSASAGTYTVSNTAGNANYTSTTFSVNAVINQNSTYPFTLTATPSASYTYNGVGIKIAYSISSYHNQLAGNLYLNNALITSVITSNTYVSSATAGTYAFVFNSLGNTNYTAKSTNITITINKATIPSATFSANTFTYNGTIPSVVFTPNTVNNQIAPVAVSLPSASVGAYTLSHTFGNNNYTNTTFSINAIINKATIPSITFSSNTFTYNGSVPTVIFTPNTFGNQIPAVTVSLPSASAGVYTLSHTFGNGNYLNTTFSINVVINKATPLLSLNLPANFTYNGTAVSIPFSINTFNNQVIANVLLNGALVKSTSTSNSINLASAGVYNITFTTRGNANYTANSITRFFKINKATVKNPFIEASLQNGQLYQINGTGSMNITSTGSITISVQLKTINSQLPASLYLMKLINGKKAFLNGTLINASNEALLKPNITTKYFAQETFYLQKGIYEFEFNSTGNQNYTGFDPAFIVNQTENSQAPSSTGGGGGGGVVIINTAPTTTTIPPANSTLSITPVAPTPQLPFFSFNLGANIVSESILQMIYLPSISFVIQSYKITIPIWVIASVILAGSALYEYKHRKVENGHYLMIGVLVLVFFWLVFLSIG